MTIRIGKFQLALGRAPVVRAPAAPYRRGINLHTWKSNETMVNSTREFLATSFGQRFLACLHAQIPHGYAHEPGQQLGRMNGFIECLATIESMAEPMPLAPDDAPINFGAGAEKDVLLDNEPT